MNSDLLHLLLTFRYHPVALTADIRKAYLQILIRPEDRDALRFLWVSDLPPASNPYPPLQEWRMTRVPFGAASSPFLLAATLQHHFRSVSHRYPATAARLSTSFYVDDLVVGCRDVAEAQAFYKETRAILQEAGMDIRKWASNSPVLQEKYLNDGIAYDNVSELGSVLCVLCVPWDRQFDEIWVPTRSVQAFAKDAPSTKRGVLQVFSRLYDPWGFLFPFAITARLLFQTLWKEKWPWDSPLQPPLLDAWHAWVNDLATLSEVRQSRWVLGSQHSLLDLQVFADASPRAYGVVVYVRSRTSDGRIKVSLLIAKGRVAPLKPLTLPRLELLGCLLAARIFCRIISSLPIAALQATFWTDSTIALHWVKNDTDKWPPLVAARTTEIRRLTNPQQWFHCEGKHNPADLLTRGVSAKALLDSQLWWSGPRWLSQEFDSAAAPVVDAEVFPTEEVCCVAVATRLDLPLRLADYSSLKHILRLTAHVLRYIHNLRYPQSRTTGPLSADELTSAELVWVRNTQSQAFPEEVAALQRSAPVSRTSTLLTLQPFLDETAVLRVGGRLQQMDDSIDIRHPILLPSKHRYSALIILDTHERLHHAGVQDTLSELRQRYWILKGRQTVRRMLHTCLPCKYRRLSPETAPVAPLPRERITQTHPFDVVGIDFAGPLYVSHAALREQKAYIVVFTCGVTRAVHLELVHQMSTERFLTAFRRFIARRGLPSVIMSDNARTFHQLSRLLAVLSSPGVQNFAANHRIRWKFIVERAPWWGGWWERIIRSVKEALKRCLGRRRLDFEGLVTALCDIESIINCRPLTYISSDVYDLDPLTPSHFLVGKRSTALPSYTAATTPQNAAELRRYFRTQEQIRMQFWSRWRKEYLLQLRSAHLGKREPDTRLKIGDVVVIHDTGAPRMVWKLGRVHRLILGRDGVVRACELTMANGSQIRRPVQLLHRLEADIEPSAAREDVAKGEGGTE